MPGRSRDFCLVVLFPLFFVHVIYHVKSKAVGLPSPERVFQKKKKMSGRSFSVKQRGKNGQSTGSATKACRIWRTSLGEMKS